MVLKETLNDETMNFFDTNKPCGGLSEDTVNIYTLDSGSPYNKVMVYKPINGFLMYDVQAYIPMWFTKI